MSDSTTNSPNYISHSSIAAFHTQEKDCTNTKQSAVNQLIDRHECPNPVFSQDTDPYPSQDRIGQPGQAAGSIRGCVRHFTDAFERSAQTNTVEKGSDFRGMLLRSGPPQDTESGFQ